MEASILHGDKCILIDTEKDTVFFSYNEQIYKNVDVCQTKDGDYYENREIGDIKFHILTEFEFRTMVYEHKQRNSLFNIIRKIIKI